MPGLKIGKATINVRETGAGTPVILLHASSSHSGQWKPLMDALAPRYRLLAPDLHGYGRSDPLPRDNKPYFRHDGAIVDALLDRTGEPAHLIGHSLGGTVAAHVARRWPRDIRSLTLIEPVLFNLLEDAEDPRRYAYMELAQAMMVMVRFGENELAARTFVEFWVGPGALDAMELDGRAYVVRTIPRVAEDWYGISRCAPGALSIAEIRGLAMPCHLLCAENTRPATRGIVELLRKALPEAQYSEIPGAGHMAPALQPNSVNPLLVKFIDRY